MSNIATNNTDFSSKDENKEVKESKESKEGKEKENKTIMVKVNLEDLNCKVCNEYMLTPKILPCTHRICEVCLFKLYSISETKRNLMKCPFCRCSISIDCPTDVFLLNILENITLERSCKNMIENSLYEKHVKTCIQCLTHEYENSKKFDIRNKPKKVVQQTTRTVVQPGSPNTQALNDFGFQLVSSVFPSFTEGYGTN